MSCIGLRHTSEKKVTLLYISLNSRVVPKVFTNCSIQKTLIYATRDFIFNIMQMNVIVAVTASDKLDKRSNEAFCLAHVRKNTIFHMIFIFIFPYQSSSKSVKYFRNINK